MKTAIKLFIAILAITALALTVVSCQKSDSDLGLSTSNPNGDGLADDYPYYGDADFGGQNFNIFNIGDNCWYMTTILNPKESADEVRQNLYIRNEKVTQRLNCSITEFNDENKWKEWTMDEGLEQSILVGPAYDAAFMGMYHCDNMIPSGYYQCLNDISTLRLNEPWWNQKMLETTSIGGDNYTAIGSVQLMSFDSMYMLFFNEDMMEDLGLEKPYDLVRNGEWDLETFYSYCRKAMNLNGDNSYALESEEATFGCVSLNDIYPVWVYSLGALEVKKDTNDIPELNIESNQYLTITQKVADYFATPGEFLMAREQSKAPYYFEDYFVKQHALFMGGWLSQTQVFRTSIDDEFVYGILPFPTLEGGDDYRTTCWYQTCGLSIPSNSPTPEKVGLLIDALGYETEKRVVQPYFARQIEQKQLKTTDSIDMLNILRRGCSFDIGFMFQWTRDFEQDIQKAAEAGQSANISQTARSYAGAIQTKMNKALEYIEEARNNRD